MANVKEFYMDPVSGNVELEYDDNSTRKFNMGEVATLVLEDGIGSFANATYDGNNRCVGYTARGVDYTITYSSDSITISGTNGTLFVVSLDGNGRITGVI